MGDTLREEIKANEAKWKEPRAQRQARELQELKQQDTQLRQQLQEVLAEVKQIRNQVENQHGPNRKFRKRSGSSRACDLVPTPRKLTLH